MIDYHLYAFVELTVHWISDSGCFIYVLFYSLGIGGLRRFIFLIYFWTFLCFRYDFILQHVLQLVWSIRKNISLNHYFRTVLFWSWSYASTCRHYLLTFNCIFYFLINLIFNFSLKIWMIQSYWGFSRHLSLRRRMMRIL